MIFRNPLLRETHTPAELRRQIRLTVVNKIAPFFGLGEERVKRLGY